MKVKVNEVVNCSGILNEEDTVACCPFYDNAHESEYCPVGDFYVDDPNQLPDDCPLRSSVFVVTLKTDEEKELNDDKAD